MKMTFMVISLPLYSFGASSAMYSGTTKLAAPTAIPTTLLPRTMTVTVEAKAWIRAPSVKRRDASKMTRLRPKLSARTEENGEMTRAKSEVEEVMIDLSRGVRCRDEREEPRDTRVEEITPVSSAY